jgi:hypothetical protein
LGGQSRTLMIVTVCPLEDTAEETLCTLNFATRVRSITLTPTTSGVKAKNAEAELKQARQEIRTLTQKRAQAEEVRGKQHRGRRLGHHLHRHHLAQHCPNA